MPRATIRVFVLAAVLLSNPLPPATTQPLGLRTPAYSGGKLLVGPFGAIAVYGIPELHAWRLRVNPVPAAAFHTSQTASYRELADSLGIVVNRSNPVDNLSFAELRRIFLGEQSHWSNGRRISVVMLEPGKQERQAVLLQICRMDDKDFDKHFSQGLSSGDIHAAPKTLATSAEVLKYVYNVPGAIGYVRVTEADDSVKILHIDSRSPGDKDYAIRLHPKPGKP